MQKTKKLDYTTTAYTFYPQLYTVGRNVENNA